MIKITYKDEKNTKHYGLDLARVFVTVAAFTKHKLDIDHLETPDHTYYSLPEVYKLKYFREATTENLVNIVEGPIEKMWVNKPLLDKSNETAKGVLRFPVGALVKSYSGALLAPSRALLLSQIISDTVGVILINKNTTLTSHLLSKQTGNFDLFPSKQFSFINNPPKMLYDMMQEYYPQMVVDSIPSKLYDEEMAARATGMASLEEIANEVVAEGQKFAESAVKKW